MKNILLIGGDRRSVEVMRMLSHAGHHVSVIGFDLCPLTNEYVTQTTIEHADFSEFDILILPVDGVSPNGRVNCPYAKSSVTLTREMIANTPVHCRIFTGIANDYLKQVTSARKLEIIFNRDDIAFYNAIPTAEATLKIAIEHTDVTIQGTPVAILGFGRVGTTVANLFKQVGADVTAFMRSDVDFAKSASMNHATIHIDQLIEEASSFSIYINTIPSLVINEKMIKKMPSNTLIIDLASRPGGTDFKAADEVGIQTIHALGLPGITAPKTAGTILARTIMKMLED